MKNLLNASVEIHAENKQAIVLRVYPDYPIRKYLPGQYGSLGLTSDKGEKLYESVINDSLKWSNPENLMYVVGANREEDLLNIRKIIPDSFILIPGVGAQGGDLKKISNAGMNKNCGIMVNVSRSIIYSDKSTNFEESVRKSALNIQREMEQILLNNKII